MGFGVNLQLPRPAAQGRMIGHGKIDPEPVHDGTDQPLALAQRQTEHNAHSQSRLDRQFTIARLAALLAGWQSFPGCDRFIRKPDRQAAAIAKAGLILPPVRDPELLPRNVVTDGGAKFERHERDSRRRERKHAVPSDRLTNQPIRPSCTKVARVHRTPRRSRGRKAASVPSHSLLRPIRWRRQRREREFHSRTDAYMEDLIAIVFCVRHPSARPTGNHAACSSRSRYRRSASLTTVLRLMPRRLA
jgi:hypothetical protein